MPIKEIYNNLYPAVAFNVQAITTDTTTNGNIIDTADYEDGVLFAMVSGTLTDGTYTPLLEESASSTFATSNVIADANIVPVAVSGTLYETGQEAALAFAATEDDTVKTVGVIGTKRYVRLSFVSASTSSGGTIGAVVLKKGESRSVYGLVK